MKPREEKTMFDASGWNPEKEAKFDNLAPATGVSVPLPPFMELAITMTISMMSVNPWLRPFLRPLPVRSTKDS